MNKAIKDLIKIANKYNAYGDIDKWIKDYVFQFSAVEVISRDLLTLYGEDEEELINHIKRKLYTEVGRKACEELGRTKEGKGFSKEIRLDFLAIKTK